jgi:arginine utilization protein RocB
MIFAYKCSVSGIGLGESAYIQKKSAWHETCVIISYIQNHAEVIDLDRDIAQKVYDLTIELTKVRSVVGTKGEIAIAALISEKIGAIEYFRQNPGQVKLLPVPGDALGRKIVIAWIEGKKAPPGSHVKTVLGLGHMDTSGDDDYGDLKEYASCPHDLKEKLRTIQFGEENRADIESPDWIFGRGVFDMKAGVAAWIVMLEIFSRREEELAGNIVFIGVPDEEGNSAGMVAAVDYLAAYAGERGWEFAAAVNTDYMTGRYPGDENKYVYVGTVGKLLPCFFVYGEETHAGEVFNGLDPNLLASAIMQEVDYNAELCDIAGGEAALPPVSLHQRDMKREYSVQTANTVTLYFNYFTHSSQPGTVLEKCKTKAVTAFENVITKLNKEYRAYCAMSHIPYTALPWRANVMTYEELYWAVKQEVGDALDHIIEETAARKIGEGADDRDISLAIVQEVHKYYSDQNSKVIVYLAPPYYPHIFVEGKDEKEQKLMTAVEKAVSEAGERFEYSIVLRKFYPFISDLSYCSISRDQDSLSKCTANMPAWGRSYTLPIESIQKISMPVVNIGPYGKDAHKLSERLCRRYSLDAMPWILRRTVEFILSN